MTKISQQIRDKLAAFVPDGYSIDDLRIASTLAQIQVGQIHDVVVTQVDVRHDQPGQHRHDDGSIGTAL